MKQRPRINYTGTGKALMWGRWQKDESLNSIALLFGRDHSLVFQMLPSQNNTLPKIDIRSPEL